MNALVADRFKLIINGGLMVGLVGVMIGALYAVATGASPDSALYGGLVGWLGGVSIAVVAAPEMFRVDWREAMGGDDEGALRKAGQLLSMGNENRISRTIVAGILCFGACRYAWGPSGNPGGATLVVSTIILKIAETYIGRAWGMVGTLATSLLFPSFLIGTVLRFEVNTGVKIGVTVLAVAIAIAQGWYEVVKTRKTLRRAQAILSR